MDFGEECLPCFLGNLWRGDPWDPRKKVGRKKGSLCLRPWANSKGSYSSSMSHGDEKFTIAVDDSCYAIVTSKEIGYDIEMAMNQEYSRTGEDNQRR